MQSEIIGVGRTAVVYSLTDDKVLKLFHLGYPKTAVEKEFANATAIADLRFPTPKAYEMVECQGQLGIVYDRVRGESLLDWVLRTGEVQQCAAYMAELHRAVLASEVRDVTSYKDFLRDNILKGTRADSAQQVEALNLLSELSDGSTLCHGDFHPGNIFISEGQLTVIDFMNVCKGPLLYDVARTVFLVQYTPMPEEMSNRADIFEFRQALAESYLKEMAVSQGMIKDFLSVIITARAGECPNEKLAVVLD